MPNLLALHHEHDEHIASRGPQVLRGPAGQGLWDGRIRYVEADAADTMPLVGMRLLDGHSLYVEVEDGGRVVIEPTATG